MTFYPDLGECGYFRRDDGSDHDDEGVRLIAVGWLDDHLPTEPVDPSGLSAAVDVLVRIWEARVDLWGVSMGRHGCGLCGMPPDRAPATEVIHKGQRLSLGSGYITVPVRRALYVAPSLIIHYVLAHGYQPPDAFLAALERCPDPRSRAYARALQSAGPSWMRWVDKPPFRIAPWRRWLASRIEWQTPPKTALGQRFRRILQRL